MDAYRVRINGRLVGDFRTFPEAEQAVEAARPVRRASALVTGNGRLRTYEAEFECEDSGHSVLAWRICGDVVDKGKE